MSEPVRRSTAFRYPTALARGVSRSRLRTDTEAGRIVRLRRGIYAASDGELDRIAAAVLSIDGAVVSHETAALLWGIPLLGRVEQALRRRGWRP